MSILIRTGSGKTDLSYTDNAVKNLKVLQKTGTKSVHWITTQAGTTYNNILQKRGVKDLFYGNITIPSDEPAWYGNPYSGSKVSWVFQTLPETSDASVPGSWTNYITGNTVNFSNNNWDYGQGNNIFKKSPTSVSQFNIYFRRDGAWQASVSSVPDMTISKLFVVDVSNPNRKAVYLLSPSGKWGVLNGKYSESLDKFYSTYHRNYTIRNSYVTIDNFYDGHTYRIGVRATDN